MMPLYHMHLGEDIGMRIHSPSVNRNGTALSLNDTPTYAMEDTHLFDIEPRIPCSFLSPSTPM